MGKAAMCIRMLQILNTGRIYKITELAGLLETNPRNIIEYKKELDEVSVEAGFYIETIPGRYGGYKLNGNAVLPAIKLDSKDRSVLVESYNHLMSDKSAIDKTSIVDVYSKIMSALLIEDKNLDFISVDKVNVYGKIAEIKKWYEIIKKSIEQKTAIMMEYEFLKEPTHVIKVHPYQLFIYDNEWRFFGWNCEINDVFYFKLSRIKDIKTTEEKFTVWKYFRIENYIKDGVFTQSGEMFHVELIASGIRAKLFKEKEYGKNQVCEDLPDGRTKVSLDMQKNHSTYNFILGCGDLIEVVEPQWLKEKVVEIATNILKKYK